MGTKIRPSDQAPDIFGQKSCGYIPPKSDRTSKPVNGGPLAESPPSTVVTIPTVVLRSAARGSNLRRMVHRRRTFTSFPSSPHRGSRGKASLSGEGRNHARWASLPLRSEIQGI